MSLPSNRNGAGKPSIAFFLVGAACVAIGGYLSTITQLNLLTGQISNPYLAVGLLLAGTGIVVLVVAQRTAKRNLRK